ncbi:MAG: acyl-CoA dehydrogenase family protein [Chloroflexota bacterium]
MAHRLFAEEHEALRQSVRRFVEKELAPHAEEWEEAQEFPREVFERMGRLGFLGLRFPEEYGGSGGDYLAETVLLEELSRCGSAGVAASIGAHISLGMAYVHAFGSEAQKKEYLTAGIAGKKISALAITEPNAGSDVASIATTARRDGDGYVLNGSKIFITNGYRADFVVVAAKTDPKAGHKGISLFLVDRGTPGFSTSRKLKKVGWQPSDTGELAFQDCCVAADKLLGQENRGFYYLMANLQWERLVMALQAVSGAQQALDMAIDYARQRQQFGQPIARFQVIRHKLADMATSVEMARQLTYHALSLYVDGRPCLREVSMAKLAACEIASRVADEAIQIHGGYGCMLEYPVQRIWRDARIGRIGGGTSEIMKEVICMTMEL